MKATKRIEMEIAADVQTKKCNGIGGSHRGSCRQKKIHFIHIEGYVSKWRPRNIEMGKAADVQRNAMG